LSALCKQQKEKKTRNNSSSSQECKVYGWTRRNCEEKNFKYLGRIINESDDDLPAVENQPKKARQVWARISRIIEKKTNCSIKIMSTFYKSIVQTILLYGSESWVLMQFIIDKLNSFHHMCARHITGRHIRLEDDVWIYPNTRITLQQANLLTIEKYIDVRNTRFSGILEIHVFSGIFSIS
jgi:acetyltransferase-like isoleucine patch superfamily enzyme